MAAAKIVWRQEAQDQLERGQMVPLLLDQGAFAVGSHRRPVGMDLREYQEVDSTGLREGK